MKSYTDLEQSKKLAKILSLGSADMTYICIDVCKGLKYMPEPRFIKNIPDHADEYDVNAWSLAALLSVLPEGYSAILAKSFDGKSYYCKIDGRHIETIADNPVDACYEMILKLHELNLL